MSLAPAFVAGYLLVAIVPGLLSTRGVTALALVAAHAMGAALLFRLARSRKTGAPRWIDWLPLAIVPFLYFEMPLLNQWAGQGYYDELVRGWEQSLLSGDPSSTWAGSMPWPVLSEVLHFAYLSYYPLIYLPPLVPFLARDAQGFKEAMTALTLTFVICFVAFIVFPVQGPRYASPAPAGVPDGLFRRLVLDVLESGSSRGTAFPSSHVAVAITQSAVAVRYGGALGYRGALGYGLFALSTALACGAVYGGFHYAVDVLAGLVVAAIAVPTALRLTRNVRGPGG